CTGRRLAQADASVHDGLPLMRVFDVLPRGWPVAAMTRQHDVGDAAGSAWLRADPVHVRPDINGARLLAHGEALQLTHADAAALLPALRPLFGDAGFLLDAPTPDRWYLQLPAGARLPAMASPQEALGADLFEHLPGFDDDASAEGRRWRALLSEAQVTLHNHPHNAQRAAAGLAPINSLWFWGGGVLPDQVRTPHAQVFSDDDAVLAFARLAGAHADRLPPRWTAGEGDRLFDLRDSRDLALLERDWFAPLLADLQAGRLAHAGFDFADGHGYRISHGQRWRFWRRPWRQLGAAQPGPE
ncbi:MAG TPA: phosphoglycerate mutase, partial [Rhodanobacteraceae bacterium]|nr:phosphoglycerate mutase [Rhodanobacteraceae bacterium]